MKRPAVSYANVMSTVAVFIALGGTSYAVARNSIGNAQLKSNAVTSSKVRNGSLTAKDLTRSALLTGTRGPRGPGGPPGTAGARGPSDGFVDTGSGPKILSATPNVPTNLAQLPNLPAGSYVLAASWYVSDFTNGGEIASCVINVNGKAVGSSASVVGNAVGSTRAVAGSTYAGVTQTAPFGVTLDCSDDQALAAPPSAVNPRLVAIRVETLRATGS